MRIPAHILKQAMELYLQHAYPGGTPATLSPRLSPLMALPDADEVPLSLLESDAANAVHSYAVRLGQPVYPHMKLVLDPAPCGKGLLPDAAQPDFILRVDSHDRHLHAAPGSPDAAWLTSVRMSNKELGEKIESAWAAAGLPTFKQYLKAQLDARRKNHPIA